VVSLAFNLNAINAPRATISIVTAQRKEAIWRLPFHGRACPCVTGCPCTRYSPRARIVPARLVHDNGRMSINDYVREKDFNGNGHAFGASTFTNSWRKSSRTPYTSHSRRDPAPWKLSSLFMSVSAYDRHDRSWTRGCGEDA
jgi:hypothetical protein